MSLTIRTTPSMWAIASCKLLIVKARHLSCNTITLLEGAGDRLGAPTWTFRNRSRAVYCSGTGGSTVCLASSSMTLLADARDSIASGQPLSKTYRTESVGRRRRFSLILPRCYAAYGECRGHGSRLWRLQYSETWRAFGPRGSYNESSESMIAVKSPLDASIHGVRVTQDDRRATELAGDESERAVTGDRQRSGHLGRPARGHRLQQSESRFRSLCESSLARVYIVQDGRIAHANPALAQILGRPPDELRVGLLAFFHPEDRPLLETAFAVWMVRCKRPGTSAFPRKDGEVVHVEVLGVRVDYGGLLLDRHRARRHRSQARRWRSRRLRSEKLLADLSAAFVKYQPRSARRVDQPELENPRGVSRQRPEHDGQVHRGQKAGPCHALLRRCGCERFPWDQFPSTGFRGSSGSFARATLSS